MNSFVDSVKQKIQLTFKDLTIRTSFKRRRFYDRSSEIPETKIILDNVSGTILPGQFVSIMGASGKYIYIPLLNHYRCWQDDIAELPGRAVGESQPLNQRRGRDQRQG